MWLVIRNLWLKHFLLDGFIKSAGANMKKNLIVPVVILTIINASACLAAGGNTILIHADANKVTISPEIYGQFAEHLGRCVYEGFWVGPNSTIPNTRGIRNDVVEALKKINVPVIRWPGGCFADEYHWKEGVGPVEQRPSSVNTYWGMVTETNRFGTHEFMDLCEMLGCTPISAATSAQAPPKKCRTGSSI